MWHKAYHAVRAALARAGHSHAVQTGSSVPTIATQLTRAARNSSGMCLQKRQEREPVHSSHGAHARAKQTFIHRPERPNWRPRRPVSHLALGVNLRRVGTARGVYFLHRAASGDELHLPFLSGSRSCRLIHLHFPLPVATAAAPARPSSI